MKKQYLFLRKFPPSIGFSIEKPGNNVKITRDYLFFSIFTLDEFGWLPISFFLLLKQSR